MKRFARPIRMMALALMAAAMLSNTPVLKAQARMIIPSEMEITEDGRVKIVGGGQPDNDRRYGTCLV